MSYEFYKILHLSAVFFAISGIAASFWGSDKAKSTKIVSGVASLLIFVAGMGLIMKGLGLSHGEGWPIWLKVKITLWILVAIGGPILGKRIGSNRKAVGIGLLLILIVAASMAVFKPV